MIQIRPLEDRVLLQRLIERDRVSPGGLHIPATADDQQPLRGRVVAVGPGRLRADGTRDGMSVEIGDVVLYREYSGTELRVKELDDDHVMLREQDLLAVEEQ